MKRRPEPSLAQALRAVRHARGIAQEEFDQVSSRTYVSALERGIKHPTVNKVAELAGVLQVHPLTLLTLSFCSTLSEQEARKLVERVVHEVADLAELAKAAGQ